MGEKEIKKPKLDDITHLDELIFVLDKMNEIYTEVTDHIINTGVFENITRKTDELVVEITKAYTIDR